MTKTMSNVLEQDLQELISLLQQELRQTNHEVLLLNLELEKRVDERTAALEAANTELEAFSYSVSHDLRAPLRAIDNFAGILSQDFSEHLPAEAQDLLKRIVRSAGKMNRMIDDLLRLARLGGQPLVKSRINLASLVREVFNDLLAQDSSRRVVLKLDQLPDCFGDLALIKQVIVNLLSNAFKFTRGKDPAIIHAGCRPDNGEVVYFIRDNGAGFDMEHARSLFGVFQRLHPESEFEGTGVGLSIVQRIIHRHGGRIWAEAELNKGATFYFTLPGTKAS
jgi:light-regulated signal transduction histidine kinase (bacteriophytochrome)